MPAEDVCGPNPSAADYADFYIDGNGAKIVSPLTAEQNARYLAARAAYQQCLSSVQQTPACPLGQYFAGALEDGIWKGRCISDTTGQPTTEFSYIPIANVGSTAWIPATSPALSPVTPVTPPSTTKPSAPAKPAGTTTPASTTIPGAKALKPADELFPGEGGGIGSYCDLFPDDPYCGFAGTLGGFAGLIGGAGVVNNSTVIYQAGILASDVHTIVNDALGGLWGVVVGAVDIALGGAIAAVQAAVTDIGNAVKSAWNILSRLSGLILKFLGQIWYTVLHGLVLALHDITTWLKDLYKNILIPLVGVLKRIRLQLLDIYKRFIRPLLIVIQDIRKVLSILAAFHVPFAAKLDAKLADLERRITQPFLILLSYVNQLANFANLIVTAGLLLQKPIFLASLKAYVGSSLNLQMNAMTKPLSAADVARLQSGGPLLTSAQSTAAAAEYIQSGTGANAALANQQTTDLQRYLYEGF